MTVAFVMSGAANFGSLQVGALQVLLEQGIQPDVLIGTSAGALNSAYLGVEATPEAAYRLADIWRNAGRDALSRSGRLMILLRLIFNHDGILPNLPLRRFLERSLPPGITRYGDLNLPAYSVAVRLDTGEIRCFGDDPADLILDGLMASTAIPGFYPPWTCDGVPYVDGGVVAYLPIDLAIKRGATEIYALNVRVADAGKRVIRGTLAIAGRALDLLIDRQRASEIELHRGNSSVLIHDIGLSTGRAIEFWDFRYSDEMVAVGREIAQAYLNGPRLERPVKRGWRDWFRRRPHFRQAGALASAVVPRRAIVSRQP
ncbi:MAG TPA: patatin-like phospholipase family protein [Anaerolineae bacterium]|nr:patatin-like phospholipase family protein [Anaerolineae bacterium]